MMDRHSKDSVLTDEMLQDFFDRGGKITKCPAYARTEDIEYKNYYGKKKKTDASE